MGIKIIKKVLISLITVIFIGTTVFATDIVRVGLSDSLFQNLLNKSVTIYGTDECEIYDKTTEQVIGNLQAYSDIKITADIDGITIQAGQNPKQKISNDIIITCPAGLLGIKTVTRKSKPALYRGDLEIVRKNNTDKFYLVNVIDVENYLKGVVPNEMPVRFGLEALKSQAVAARNYALAPRVKAYKEFDLTDTVASQVYFGANSEMPLSNQAISETTGVLALYEETPILALYCSTAGGYTESYNFTFSEPISKEFPSKPISYLTAKPDILTQSPLDDEEKASEFYKNTTYSCYDMKSPYYRWQRHWQKEELRQVLEKTLFELSAAGFVKPEFKKGDELGEIKELKVLMRGYSGKIAVLEIITDKTNYKIYKEITIRRVFKKDGKALPSANLVFEFNFDDVTDELIDITAYGGGYGHGVGMSQFGAGFMSTELKKTYADILKHYYSGISIGTKPFILSNKEISQVFYTIHPKTQIVICNPQHKVTSLIVSINGEKIEFPTHKTIGIKECKIDISDYIKQGENKITFYPLTTPEVQLKLYIELVAKDDEYYF